MSSAVVDTQLETPRFQYDWSTLHLLEGFLPLVRGRVVLGDQWYPGLPWLCDPVNDVNCWMEFMSSGCIPVSQATSDEGWQHVDDGWPVLVGMERLAFVKQGAPGRLRIGFGPSISEFDNVDVWHEADPRSFAEGMLASALEVLQECGKARMRSSHQVTLAINVDRLLDRLQGRAE